MCQGISSVDAIEKGRCLVAVDIALERTGNIQTKVLGLNGSELGQLGIDVLQVEQSNLLVQDLGKNVDANGLLAGGAELDVLLAKGLVLGLEQSNLGKNLVGEGAGHDEGRVAGGTAKVDQTTLGKEDDVAAVGHQVAVNLGLNVLDGLGVGLEPGNVNLNVEVTNVANNGVVTHNLKVLANKNVTATGGGDEDLTLGSSLLHGDDLVSLNSGLKGVDGVNLGDEDTGTHAAESIGTALADITVTSNNGDLAGNHDVGGTLDTIDERLTATVQVVELGLGDGVVDVDRGNKELALLEHSVEVVNTSGGLLGDTVAALEHLRVLAVDEGGQITTIVEDEVELLAILESVELLLQAPLVLLLGLTLPGKDRDAGGSNGGSSMVLGGEDIAAGPGDLSTKGSEGLDENSGLDGHVKATGNASTLQGLVLGVLAADSHETRHLNLGELDLAAAKGSQRDIGDLELLSGGSHGDDKGLGSLEKELEGVDEDEKREKEIERGERKK